MAKFTDLIPQNVAPLDAKCIGLYSRSGKRLCQIELGHLAPPELGEKRYSFGVISDLHLFDPDQYSGGVIYDTVTADHTEQDVIRAMTDLQDTDLICIAGDMTHGNHETEWEKYRQIMAGYSADTPIYPICGNHDCSGGGMTNALFRQYAGLGEDKGLCYTFTPTTKGGAAWSDDVFIMLSMAAWPSSSANITPFLASQLQWLYETLEENRDKRCFVFLHLFPLGHSGDPFGLYQTTSWVGTQQDVVLSLMAHYKNAIWFHGHSHQLFQVQRLHEEATYDRSLGGHNIHVPSVSIPYDVVADGENKVRELVLEGSQGYVVDVYGSYIMLQGRDFAARAFLPISTYCLETTLQTVEAGTYADPTGTITI